MSTYQAGVPSAAERTGDFGGLCAQGGSIGPRAVYADGSCVIAGQLYDPYSGVYNSNDGGPRSQSLSSQTTELTYTAARAVRIFRRTFASPVEPAPCPGNLIDPVAQNDAESVPSAEHTE